MCHNHRTSGLSDAVADHLAGALGCSIDCTIYRSVNDASTSNESEEQNRQDKVGDVSRRWVARRLEKVISISRGCGTPLTLQAGQRIQL